MFPASESADLRGRWLRRGARGIALAALIALVWGTSPGATAAPMGVTEHGARGAPSTEVDRERAPLPPTDTAVSDPRLGADTAGAPPRLQPDSRPSGRLTPQQATQQAYTLVDTWTSRDPAGDVPQLDRPVGLDVADDGTIYVADRGAGTVFHLSSSGALIGSWQPTSASGPFDPVDVAVGPDRVYVIGPPGGGGEIRDRAGNRLAPWSPSAARGVAVGPDGRVYVSAALNVAAIHIHGPDGVFQEAWTAEPLIRIVEPFGIDVGPDGTVYLAADDAVYTFLDERVRSGFRVPRAIEGQDVLDVAVDGQRVYAIQSGYLIGWTADEQPLSPASTSISGGAGLAVGPGSGLLVSSVHPSFTGLSFLTDRSQLNAAVQRWGDADQTLGQLIGPYRLATDASGRVYVIDRLERVQQWSPAGLPMSQWMPQPGVDLIGGGTQACVVEGAEITCLGPAGSTAWSVAPSPDGWLSAGAGSAGQLVTVDLATQRLWRLDASGAVIGSAALAGDGEFAAITDVAMDGPRIFVADRGVNGVRILAADGSSLGAIDVPRGPARLAAADGFVWAATLDGYVFKYAQDGTVMTVVDPDAEEIADIAVAGSRLYVADRNGDRILVYDLQPGGTPPDIPPAPPEERCDVTVDKRALPGQVLQGETVTVELAVAGSCPFGDEALDVVMIVDRSGSMAGPKIAGAKTAAVAFLSELNPETAQVGLVAFSTAAEVTQGLTGDLRGVVQAVAGLEANGQTFYEEALNLAVDELYGPTGRPFAGKVVVMLTDGHPTDLLRGERAAEALKDRGATLYTIGLGEEVDDSLLAEMASSPDLYFKAPTEAELSQIYTAIARRIGATRLLREGTVTDELPADMRLVPGSTRPPAQVTGNTLTWALTDVPLGGTTLRYEVRPQEPGLRPTNVVATLEYIDTLRKTGTLTFPVPEVEVIARTHWVNYLPAVTNAQCQPKRADVVLAIDTSSSMTEPAVPGGSTTKLQAAVRAARTFLDAMSLPGDQAAIVTFDTDARVVQGLTGSRSRLELALAGIESGFGTRIDRGIEASIGELIGPGHVRGNAQTLILLTDGRPAPGTEGDAYANAVLARQMGIQIYGIGLGDVDPILMLLLVGPADHYFFAPDATTLSEVYGQIAGDVLCR